MDFSCDFQRLSPPTQPPPPPPAVIFNEEHLRGVEPLLFPRRLLQSPCLLLIGACILLHASYCDEGDGGGVVRFDFAVLLTEAQLVQIVDV